MLKHAAHDRANHACRSPWTSAWRSLNWVNDGHQYLLSEYCTKRYKSGRRDHSQQKAQIMQPSNDPSVHGVKKLKTRSKNMRNKTQHTWQHTRLLNDWMAHKREKAVMQRLIRQKTRELWQNYCANLKEGIKDGTVWKAIRAKENKAGSRRAINVLVNSSAFADDKQKADLFAKRFAIVSSTTNYADFFASAKNQLEQLSKYKLNRALSDKDLPINDAFTCHLSSCTLLFQRRVQHRRPVLIKSLTIY
jgi:hypothetical protein